MKRRFLATAVGILSAAVLVIAPLSSANARMMTVGEQDFEDGSFIDFASIYDAEQTNEDGPFGGIIGSDPFGGSFTADWSFSWEGGAMSSAQLSFGMYDSDAAADGDQVTNFTVDGVDLTDMMNDVFESGGGAQNEYNVYTLSLPADIMVQLTDGMANISLTLGGPTFYPFGNNNGAGLDFSTLQLLPEPSLALLTLSGIFALAAARPRRRC